MSGHKAEDTSFLQLYSKLQVKVQPAACHAVAGAAVAACAAAVPLSAAGTNVMTPG